MSTLGTELVRVTRFLERDAVPYMVIGGFANLVWGEPRSTIDLDITVDVSGDGLAAFVTLAAEIGEVLPDDPIAFAERTKVLPVRTPDGITADFVIATLSFELEAITRARPVEVEGTPVPICSPEDLIIHKVVSERARDHEDVVGVLRRQGRSLDLASLDRAVGGLADQMEEPEVAERYRQAKRAAGLAGE